METVTPGTPVGDIQALRTAPIQSNLRPRGQLTWARPSCSRLSAWRVVSVLAVDFSCVSLYCRFGITHQFPRRNPGVDFLVAYTAPASSPPFGSSSGDNHRSHSAHQRSRDMAGCPRFVWILVCPPVVFVLAHSSTKHSRRNPGAGLLVAFTAPQAPLFWEARLATAC